MEQIIKDVFDKISMEEQKRKEIREELAKKNRIPIWVKCVACAAMCMIALLIIPSTRTTIANAAKKVIRIFHTADGGEVIYQEKDNELSFSISDPDNSYVRVEVDRIYLTVDDRCIDVTGYCGEDTYYRYEAVNADGSKSVILVGGTLERAGFVELLYDANGKYVFNKMNVPADEYGFVQPWVNNAMNNEGVPTGDPELDNEL